MNVQNINITTLSVSEDTHFLNICFTYLFRVQCISEYPPTSSLSHIIFLSFFFSFGIVSIWSTVEVHVWHVYFKRSLLFFIYPCQIDHTRYICFGHFYIVKWHVAETYHSYRYARSSYFSGCEKLSRYISTKSSCFFVFFYTAIADYIFARNGSGISPCLRDKESKQMLLIYLSRSCSVHC